MDKHPIQEGGNTPSCFMLQKIKTGPCLIGHSALVASYVA